MTERNSRDERVDAKIRCDACPVMCYIADGKSGACDRYANDAGQLVRLDPLVVMQRRVDEGGSLVPFWILTNHGTAALLRQMTIL